MHLSLHLLLYTESNFSITYALSDQFYKLFYIRLTLNINQETLRHRRFQTTQHSQIPTVLIHSLITIKSPRNEFNNESVGCRYFGRLQYRISLIKEPISASEFHRYITYIYKMICYRYRFVFSQLAGTTKIFLSYLSLSPIPHIGSIP